MDEETLRRLVDVARRGDPDAVAALVQEFRPRIFRFVLARLGDPEAADDVTQETCVALVMALPTYEDRGFRLSSFVFGIAHNKVAMERRSASRRPPTTTLDDLFDRPTEQPGPEEHAVVADQIRALAEPREALTERDREIVLLRVVAQLSAEEVAGALDMTPGAVRVAQHRALQTLRARMAAGEQA